MTSQTNENDKEKGRDKINNLQIDDFQNDIKTVVRMNIWSAIFDRDALVDIVDF